MGSIHTNRHWVAWINLLDSKRREYISDDFKTVTIREMVDYCQQNNIPFSASDTESLAWDQIEKSVTITLNYHLDQGAIAPYNLDKLDYLVQTVYLLWREGKILDHFNNSQAPMVLAAREWMDKNDVPKYFYFQDDKRELIWNWENLWVPILHQVPFIGKWREKVEDHRTFAIVETTHLPHPQLSCSIVVGSSGFKEEPHQYIDQNKILEFKIKSDRFEELAPEIERFNSSIRFLRPQKFLSVGSWTTPLQHLEGVD